MTCGKFDARERPRMSPDEFAEHARACAECAAKAALDARLDAELVALRDAIPAPGLWDKIELTLGREKARASARDRDRRLRGGLSLAAVFGRRPLLAAAGAAVLLAIALGAIVLLTRSPASPGILSRRALAKVEIKEKEYAEAIAAMENQAGSRIEAMDLQMASLYRDKLAAINAQIERCREALASNPGNTHIRRYLLAALHDKRETLAGVLGAGLWPEPSERREDPDGRIEEET